MFKLYYIQEAQDGAVINDINRYVPKCCSVATGLPSLEFY